MSAPACSARLGCGERSSSSTRGPNRRPSRGCAWDFAWPEAKVALEYEGAYHFEDGQIVRDDDRVNRLRAAGWIVIRVSAADLRNLDAVVEKVKVELASR